MVEKVGLIGSLSASGGIEKLTIDIINVLNEEGMEVYFLPIGKIDEDCTKLFGKNLNYLKIVQPSSLKLSRFLVDKYKSLIIPFAYKEFEKNVDLIIDTFGVPVPLFKSSVPYLLYVHFPIDILDSVGRPYAPLLWKFEILTLKHILRVMNKITHANTLHYAKLLCNSNYTRRWIKRVWNIEAEVLYPPINLREYNGLFEKEPRRNQIVVIARFSPEKKHDICIKALKEVVREIPNVKLALVGTSKNIFARRYIKHLKTTIYRLSLDGNVYFYENMKYKDLLQLLSKSKIVLHPTPYEHFGISVIEGIAAGCVPVVHSSGGPYEDIIERGKYGLFFSNENELVEVILKILKDDKYRKKMKLKAYKRVYNQFTYVKFKKNLLEFIEKIV